MATKKYSLFKAIPMSVYSYELYRDVCRKWKGLGLLYLALAISILFFPSFLNQAHTLSNISEFDTSGDHNHKNIPYILAVIIDQLPEIKIKDGKVSTNVQQPYNIVYPATGEEIIVIDTTGQIKSLSDTKAAALLTEKAFYIRGTDGQENRKISIADLNEATQLAPNSEVTIDRDIAAEWLQDSAYSMSFIFYISHVVLAFISFAMRVLMFAAIGMIFCQFLRIKLPLQILFRLTVIASTPVIILEGLESFIDRDLFAYGAITYFLVQAIYTYIAVEANAQKQ